MNTSSTPRLRDPVASRRLRLSGRPARFMIIRLDRPRRTGRDWVCWFEITGAGRHHIDRAYGADAVQALTLGLEAARLKLQDWKVRIVNELEPFGLPRMVPYFMGASQTRRLYRLVDREVERWGARVKPRASRARRSKGSRLTSA